MGSIGEEEFSITYLSRGKFFRIHVQSRLVRSKHEYLGTQSTFDRHDQTPRYSDNLFRVTNMITVPFSP